MPLKKSTEPFSIKKTLRVFAATALLAVPIIDLSYGFQLNTYEKLLSTAGLERLMDSFTVQPAPKAEKPKLVVENYISKNPIITDASCKSKVIVLDAGHGGKDPGTCHNGYQEKDITLSQALKVKQILESRGYTNVKLTRESDEFIGLEERVNIGENYGADIYVSLHCDSAVKKNKKGELVTDPNMRGITCYERKGIKDRLLAKPINEELERTLKSSKRFDNNRGVRDSKLRVLKIKSPATLVESSMLSNTEDVRTLTDETPDIETAVANGIELYLKLPGQIKEQCKPYDEIIERKTKELSQKLGHELDSDLVRAVLFRESPKGETVDPMQVATPVAYAFKTLKAGKEHTNLFGDFSKLDNRRLEDNLEAGIAWLFFKAADIEERTVEGETQEKYTVQKKDTYDNIAKKKGTTVDTLKNLNPNVDPKKLIPGVTVLTVKYAKKEWYINPEKWKPWEAAVRSYGPKSRPGYVNEVMEYYRIIKEAGK
jgi:N-acetylmuramoyl-L-alanine amidase